MIDLYLRATDEAEVEMALIRAGLAYRTDGEFMLHDGVYLDRIGIITRLETNETGEIVREETLAGWHANVRVPDLTTLAIMLDDSEPWSIIQGLPLIEAPDQPVRVWA